MKSVIVRAQQKWETTAVTRKTEAVLVDEMNELGEHGWEIVSVFHYKDGQGSMTWTAFLKRPKLPQGRQTGSGGSRFRGRSDRGKAGEAPAESPGFDLSGEIFEVKK